LLRENINTIKNNTKILLWADKGTLSRSKYIVKVYKTKFINITWN
jgi:hypothetical protein